MVKEDSTSEAAGTRVITLDDAIRNFSVEFDLEPLQRALRERQSNEVAEYKSGRGQPVVDAKFLNGVYELGLVLYSDGKTLDVDGEVTERADNKRGKFWFPHDFRGRSKQEDIANLVITNKDGKKHTFEIWQHWAYTVRDIMGIGPGPYTATFERRKK